MKQSAQYVMLAGAIGCSFFAQQLPPTAAARPSFQAQSPSSVSLTGKGEEQTLRIHNVAYEVSSDSVPGRPRGERLLLRRTTSSSRVLGEIGQTAGTVLVIRLCLVTQGHVLTVECWDQAPGMPVLQEAPGFAETGRGLAIIDSLTGGAWGCRPAIGQVGKCVWADISLRNQPASPFPALAALSGTADQALIH